VSEQGFQVIISGWSSSADEWKRAMTAPESELEAKSVLPLSEDQKEMAQRFHIDDEEYARSELSMVYGRERIHNAALHLGEIVQKLLSEFSPDLRLVTVLYEHGNLRWLFRIETAHGVRKVSAPEDLIDDVLDSEFFMAIEQLKNHLRTNLNLKQVAELS
jgi:hypothetical protein